MKQDGLNRFLEAQSANYEQALDEIRHGKKRNHWMWYIFPQLAGLGFSDTSKFYGIKDIVETEAYLAHPLLGSRLIEISSVVLTVKNKTAREIFGSPDDLKLNSCMTLFGAVEGADEVFGEVLDEFFRGKRDDRTLSLLKSSS